MRRERPGSASSGPRKLSRLKKLRGTEIENQDGPSMPKVESFHEDA
jgi:hypothetical protein